MLAQINSETEVSPAGKTCRGVINAALDSLDPLFHKKNQAPILPKLFISFLAISTRLADNVLRRKK